MDTDYFGPLRSASRLSLERKGRKAVSVTPGFPLLWAEQGYTAQHSKQMVEVSQPLFEGRCAEGHGFGNVFSLRLGTENPAGGPGVTARNTQKVFSSTWALKHFFSN